MAEHMHGEHRPDSGGRVGRWIFGGFVLVAVYFLLTEHRAHVFQYLPFLLLLACPLMHLFHGHGGHGQHAEKEEEPPAKANKAGPDKKNSGGCH